MLPALRVCAVRANNPAIVRLMSDAPQRFGHSGGDSGWRWEKNGVGMGGKEAGPATEIKEGLGKDYPNQQFFKYDKYSYFDIEKDVVDSKTRNEQPVSNMTEFW
jgi:hypothetical protein